MVRFGAVLNVVLACIVAGVLTWFGTWSMSSSSRRFVEVPAAELALALVRTGLDAESLAAVGLTAEQTGLLVSRTRTHLTSSIQVVRDADINYSAKKATVDQLQRVVQSGVATEEQKSQYVTAKSELVTLTSARQTALNAVFTAAVDGISQDTVAALGRIKTNRVWELPCKYLIKDRSQNDWVALREALANDRVSASLGRTPDQGGQQLILSAAADASVAAAGSSLSNNLGAVTSAWSTAVYP
jgi:hypothetical protein